MSEYRFFRDGTGFTVTKNKGIFCTGHVIVSMSAYSFEFSDFAGNDYLMEAKGLFFWRKIKLLKNGSFVENFNVNRSKRTNIQFDRRFFIREKGEYVHHVDTCREEGEHGQCRYYWSETPSHIELQVVCLVILHFINSLQGPNGSLQWHITST